MPTFSIKESVSFGWQKVKANVFFFVALTAMYAIASMVANWPNGVLSKLMHKGGDIVSILIFLVLTAAGIYFRVLISTGLQRIFLDAEEGKEVSYQQLIGPYQLFFKFFFTGVLLGVIVGVGFMLLIVPGIILALGLCLSMILVVDRHLGPIDALKESWRMTTGHKWHLLKFILTLAGINMLGALALGVGLLVTIPLSGLAMAHVYRKIALPALSIPQV